MDKLIKQSPKCDFVDVPSFSNYAVTRSGKVLNKLENRFLKGSRNAAGYYNFRLKGDSGLTHTWGRHRLLCCVFKPRLDMENLYVNHKNGIKGDDRLNNLEWITPQGNVEHAGKLGITNKCLPIQTYCVRTKDIKNYPSVSACARDVGLSKDAVLYRIKFPSTKVFPEGKCYRQHSNCEWDVGNIDIAAILNNGTNKHVTVRFLLTGEVIGFEKMSHLASYLKCPLPTLSVWLKYDNQPVLPGFIQLQFTARLTEWREVSDVYLELERFTGNSCVVSVNVNNNTVKTFETAAKCATYFNISPTCLNYRLREGKDKIFSGHLFYYYLTFINTVRL